MEGELMKYQDQVIQKEINILVEVQIVIPIVQFQLVSGIVTSQNLLFQMREVLMFCISGKEMGAPQETGCMTAPGILPRWQVRSSHSMD